MIWAAISWYFAGPIITLSGRIAVSGYVNILGNQVDPMVQMFFHKNNAVFFFKEDKSLIHTARRVQPWFDVYEASLQHLSWPAQSPDLNIIESMWSVWQSGLRSRVPPAWSLNQPDVLHEQWYSIALRLFRTYMSLFQKEYKLYYRLMVVQLRINKEMCILHNCSKLFVPPVYM